MKKCKHILVIKEENVASTKSAERVMFYYRLIIFIVRCGIVATVIQK